MLNWNGKISLAFRMKMEKFLDWKPYVCTYSTRKTWALMVIPVAQALLSKDLSQGLTTLNDIKTCDTTSLNFSFLHP